MKDSFCPLRVSFGVWRSNRRINCIHLTFFPVTNGPKTPCLSCGKVPVCRWHFGTGVNGTGYPKHSFCKDQFLKECMIALPKSESYLSSLEMRHFLWELHLEARRAEEGRRSGGSENWFSSWWRDCIEEEVGKMIVKFP